MKSELERLAVVQPLFKSLYEAAKEKLAFEPDAKIVILTNEENSNNPIYNNTDRSNKICNY